MSPIAIEHLVDGQQDVGEDLDGLLDVAGEALGVVDGLLAAGVGVQVRAHVLHLQLGLAALAGALRVQQYELTRNTAQYQPKIVGTTFHLEQKVTKVQRLRSL